MTGLAEKLAPQLQKAGATVDDVLNEMILAGSSSPHMTYCNFVDACYRVLYRERNPYIDARRKVAKLG